MHPNFPIKTIVSGVAGVIIAAILSTGLSTTNEGYKYVVQDTALGSVRDIHTSGWYLAVPLASKQSVYNAVATVTGGVLKEGAPRPSGYMGRATVSFADNYKVDLTPTIRFKLPDGREEFLNLHKDVQGQYSNVVSRILIPRVKSLMTATAQMYLGENFIQGGTNEFRIALQDQLENGTYVTRREEVTIVEQGLEAVSSSNDNANKAIETSRTIYKQVIQRKSDGTPRRSVNPLVKYGITVIGVELGTPDPDDRLENMIKSKMALIEKRITAVQSQETTKEEAKAEQLKREISKRAAIQEAQKAKELATIHGQLRVEQAHQTKREKLVIESQRKEVALIQKQRELEVAESNEAIQKANAIAANHQATAVLSIGLAEAQVTQAEYAAKQSAKDIVMAEIELERSRVMYPALKDVTIDMPDYYVGGGSDAPAPNSLEVFTNLGAIEKLKQASK